MVVRRDDIVESSELSGDSDRVMNFDSATER